MPSLRIGLGLGSGAGGDAAGIAARQSGGGSSLLLDDYSGAAAAYSVRKLNSGYSGNCMRVRRASDDAEQDIGFDSNGLVDTSAIATHCGSSNGFVVTWYGQEADGKGNGNDATQTSASEQPKIYDGTAVITENGKPKLEATQQWMDTGVALSGTSYHFTVAKNDASRFVHYSNAGSAPFWAFGSTGSDPAHNGVTPSYYKNGVLQTTVTRAAILGYFGSQAVITTTHSTAISSLRLGYNISFPFASAHEFVIYNSDQSSNRTAIEDNINSEYLIYQPTTTPTSGLLADYSGAAVAYSVRRLSDKAVIAMRIRRDSDDAETNIGFDSNGDLDTTAISDFCSTANGYVVQWTDQSTNGDHAAQSAAADQPQIYNGTAVITDNGKPAIYHDLDRLGISTSHTGDVTTSMVIHPNRSRYVVHGVYTRFEAKESSSGLDIPTDAVFVNGVSNTPTTEGELWTALTQDQINLIHTEDVSGSVMGTSGSTNRYTGWVQEMVVWESDQLTNRSGIESDTNTYFSIY